MRLPWRDVTMGAGPIPTSLTPAETVELQRLARGRRVLEVGSAYGYSAIVMALADAKKVIAVDPHQGYGAMPDSLTIMRENLLRYGVEDIVEIVQSSSRDWEPGSQTFGMVFTDADHRSQSVSHDLGVALDVIAVNGIIAFHDYGEDTCEGVKIALDGSGIVPARVIDTLWIYENAIA